MTSLPKIGTSATGNLGVATVSKIVFTTPAEGGLGFIFRSQPDVDVGIDGHIEIVHRPTGEATGKLVGVQVKAGPSFFKSRTAGGWTVPIKKETVRYWQQYAVPVVMTVVDLANAKTFWVLVSEGDFEETSKSYKIFVPEKQILDASAADQLAQLAMQAPTALLAKLSALSAEISAATADELARHQMAWRDGRRSDAREWLQSVVRSPARLAALDAPVAASVLRYAAAVTLDEDGDAAAAQEWTDEAAGRDPFADDARLRAALIARSGDPLGAINMLAVARSPNAQIFRATLVARMGDHLTATAIIDGVLGPWRGSGTIEQHTDVYRGAGGRADARVGTQLVDGSLPDRVLAVSKDADDAAYAAMLSDVDRSEAWRLRAMLRVTTGDLPGALQAVANAEALTPRHASVRRLRAMLTYLGGLAADALPQSLALWPQPIPEVLLRDDPAAVAAFGAASDQFAQLLVLDWTSNERRHLQAWRLAALIALPAGEAAATEFAREVLALDNSQPFVILLAASAALPLDLSPHLDALAAEADLTGDLQAAVLFMTARIVTRAEADAVADMRELGAWWERWKPRFDEAGALADWSWWRARVHVGTGDYAEARALLAGMEPPQARALQAEILTAEARDSGGDDRALVEHLESVARESGDVQFLFEAVRARARIAQWNAVAPHVDELLRRVPTKVVRRLATFARFNTSAYDACVALIDEALSMSEAQRTRLTTDERLEFLRMRAQAHHRLGNLLGVIDDMRAIVAEVSPPAIADLLELARALYFAGQTHELASCARELRRNESLDAHGALTLCEMLVHDDAPLAHDFWQLARAGGVVDADVPRAVALGFQLGLEPQLGELQARMFAMAGTGTASVQQITVDELIERQRTWAMERERLLTQYRQGDIGTQLVAQFLYEPLVHLYHVVAGANEAETRRRFSFPLQFRDGGRGQPEVGSDLAAPGRLALDLSSLLLAAHLEILADLEAQFAPLQLPQLVIVALREQRDKLRPHQPSRIEVVRRLLNAERAGHVRTWDGDLPALTAGERESADHWGDWVALLERARRESAFVVDLPLGPDAPHGRPAGVAGTVRLERLLTPDDVRRFLRDEGVIDATDSGRTATDETPGASKLRRGAFVYLTDGGAEALAAADLLARAAEVLTLLVGPDDQAARQAQLAALPDLEERVGWMEALIRRVSDGLIDGRYALLPPGDRRSRGDETDRLSVPDHENASRDEVRPAMPDGEPEAVAVTEGITTNVSRPSGAPSEASDAGASSAEEPAEHWREIALPLRCLADLISLPSGSVDAVCIDDRWINQHPLAGTTRMTDILELISALEAAGRVTDVQKWDLYLRLRAANVRVVPLNSAEINHHVQRAQIVDGAIAETRALRILRQYAAALLADLDALRVPQQGELEFGMTGELDVVRRYTFAVRHSLLDTWKRAKEHVDKNGDDVASATTRAEAESTWLLDNLYVDLALLRARAVKPPSGADVGISAFDAASLLTAVVTLVPSVTEPAASGHDFAVAYAEWVYENIVAPRAEQDLSYRDTVVDQIRLSLSGWTERSVAEAEEENDDTGLRDALARRLAARVFDVLPAQLRDVLEDDSAFMARIGRVVFSSLTAGPWSFETNAFAEAAASLIAKEMDAASITDREENDPSDSSHLATHAPPETARDALAADDVLLLSDELSGASAAGIELEILGSEPAATVLLSHADADTFVLVSRRGGQSVRLHDAAFGLLAASTEARRRACEKLRGDADVGVEEWRAITEHVVALEPAGARLQALMAHRVAALSSHYATKSERWAATHQIMVEDLRAPSVVTVLKHLRLGTAVQSIDGTGVSAPTVDTPVPQVAADDDGQRVGGANAESTTDGDEQDIGEVAGTSAVEATLDDSLSERWDAAAAMLIAEEGLAVAFDRLSGVPRPLPQPIRSALDALLPDDRHAFARRLIRTSTSPIAAAHAMRVLAIFGATDGRYLRAARRLMRILASRRSIEYVALLREVAAAAERTYSFRVPTTGSGAGGHAVTDLLVASWYHAHCVLSGVSVAGFDPARLLHWLKNHPALANPSGPFRRETSVERDVAHPTLVSPPRFLVAAAQYASADTGLLQDATAVLTALLAAVTPAPTSDHGDGTTNAQESSERTVEGTPGSDENAETHDAWRVPHAALLRDLGGRPNGIDSWLQPARGIDGSILVGTWPVVPSSATPHALADHALEALGQDLTNAYGWWVFEAVYGSDPLPLGVAERFSEITATADLETILPILGSAAPIAAARLAREMYGVGDSARRDRFRTALMQLAAAGRGRGQRGATAPRPVAEQDGDELTHLQHAVLGTLYLLAQAEPSAVDAMRRFATDLANLARADVTYPRRVRDVVERLMRERPLDEALACLALLAEARSV